MNSLEDLEKAFANGLSSWQNQIVERNAKVMGLKLVRECKRLTKVKTGNLRRRWFFKIDYKTGEIRIWVSNDADYAAWVNNGHRIVRAHKTVGRAQGKHMLEKGIETYQREYMKQDVENMLNELGSAMK